MPTRPKRITDAQAEPIISPALLRRMGKMDALEKQRIEAALGRIHWLTSNEYAREGEDLAVFGDDDERYTVHFRVISGHIFIYDVTINDSLIQSEDELLRTMVQGRVSLDVSKLDLEKAPAQPLTGRQRDRFLSDLSSLMKKFNVPAAQQTEIFRSSSDALRRTAEDFPTTKAGPKNGEKYAHRTIASESAPEFIARVYRDALNGEFTRADLRKCDEQAEMALRNWERRNGRSDLNLPTVKERNDRLLSENPLLKKSPETAEHDRLRAVLQKRRQRSPKSP